MRILAFLKSAKITLQKSLKRAKSKPYKDALQDDIDLTARSIAIIERRVLGPSIGSSR